jgi:hypothetical protein
MIKDYNQHDCLSIISALSLEAGSNRINKKEKKHPSSFAEIADYNPVSAVIGEPQAKI